MTVPLKTVEGARGEGTADVRAIMAELGRRGRAAARTLALASRKDEALDAMGQFVRDREREILAANAEDVAESRATGATTAFLDRLTLDHKRIAAMADGIEVVRRLADPVGPVR